MTVTTWRNGCAENLHGPLLWIQLSLGTALYEFLCIGRKLQGGVTESGVAIREPPLREIRWDGSRVDEMGISKLQGCQQYMMLSDVIDHFEYIRSAPTRVPYEHGNDQRNEYPKLRI